VVMEDGVQWDRVRAPPVDTLARDLHASDCLHELRPGDHIEIQWRRNKEFPYGMFPSTQQQNACFRLCHIKSLNTIIWHMLILSDSGHRVFYQWTLCSSMHFYVWQAGGMGLLATWNHVMEMSAFVGVILVVRI
jgi:hypothetical protein